MGNGRATTLPSATASFTPRTALALGLSTTPSRAHQELSHDDQATLDAEAPEGGQGPTGSASPLYGVGATGANSALTVSETMFVTSDGASFAWSSAWILIQSRPKRTSRRED